MRLYTTPDIVWDLKGDLSEGVIFDLKDNKKNFTRQSG